MTWPMYVALAAALFSSSCGGQAEAAQSSAQPTSWGLLEYAQACRERIGVIPELDARKGVVIPITVNGQVPETTPHTWTATAPPCFQGSGAMDSACPTPGCSLCTMIPSYRLWRSSDGPS